MKITSITATASRTFNHPYERYANFRFEFTANAELTAADDYELNQATLAYRVEKLAETHKQAILAACEVEAKIKRLQDGVRYGMGDDEHRACAEREIDELQRRRAALPVPHPEIFPGHPDHPDTQESGYDDGEG